MIFWASPTYFGGRSSEFERLMTHKFAFSLVTLALLLAAGLLTRTFSSHDASVKAEKG
jgi:hypothetical protein